MADITRARTDKPVESGTSVFFTPGPLVSPIPYKKDTILTQRWVDLEDPAIIETVNRLEDVADNEFYYNRLPPEENLA